MQANPRPRRPSRPDPAIEALLEAERRRRAESWIDLAPPLCGLPSRPLTPRMVMELRYAGNAFLTPGAAILWADVADVLWRLHPRFYRPGSARRFFDWPTRSRVLRHIRRLAAANRLFATTEEITDRLAAAFLDAPATDSDRAASGPLTAESDATDSIVLIALRYAVPLRRHPLDIPYTQLLQLRRAELILQGHAAEIIDPVHAQIQQLRRANRPSPPARL